MKITFFGREPALWLSLISSVVMIVSSFAFALSPEQQGVINAVALAFFGLLTAWSMARDGLSAAILGLIKAILALGIAFGLQMSSANQAIVMTLVAAVSAMFIRTQAVASVPPATASIPVLGGAAPAFRALLVAALLPALMFGGSIGLTSCATTFTGKSEQATQLTADVFNAFVTAERQLNPLPVSAAVKATPLHQYAEVIRRNGVNWLQTAEALTDAYRLNPTSANETALQQALAVVAAALAQSQIYLAQLNHQ
jgi:hypothetical protein